MFSIDDIARILALFMSIILHELAHGYVALLNGDRTAKDYGRLTLNPVKHFDMTGFLMMLFLRFGYAKPVPVNYYNFRKRRLGIFTVSIAGVTLNLLLAFLFTPLLMLTDNAWGIGGNVLTQLAVWFLFYMVIVNITLAIFNLLPLYPLDGFRVIESVTRYNNPFVNFMRKYGGYILMGLVLISIITRFLNSYFPSAAWEKVDLLGYILGTLSNKIFNGFVSFWSLLIR